MLAPEVRSFLDLHRLGFVATVSPDGRPNVSPKGTMAGWEGGSVIFADICSPDTVANIASNPAVEISIIDPVARRGYLISGTAAALGGAELGRALEYYAARGVRGPVRGVVRVDVAGVSEVASPLYAAGVPEAEIRAGSRRYLEGLF